MKCSLPFGVRREPQLECRIESVIIYSCVNHAVHCHVLGYLRLGCLSRILTVLETLKSRFECYEKNKTDLMRTRMIDVGSLMVEFYCILNVVVFSVETMKVF